MTPFSGPEPTLSSGGQKSSSRCHNDKEPMVAQFIWLAGHSLLVFLVKLAWLLELGLVMPELFLHCMQTTSNGPGIWSILTISVFNVSETRLSWWLSMLAKARSMFLMNELM